VPTFETTLSPKKHGNQSYSISISGANVWNNAVPEEARQSVLFISFQIQIPVSTLEQRCLRRNTAISLIQLNSNQNSGANVWNNAVPEEAH
jgi:hypothetical protein